MRCGNCKQSHSTVNEVIGCYHDSGTQLKLADRPNDIALRPPAKEVKRTAPPTGTEPKLTVKQAQFIESLLKQTGKTEADLPHPLKELSIKQASEVIGELKKEKQVVGHTVRDMKLPATIDGTQVPQGTYTVVFSPDEDDRLTIRFREPATGKWVGTQLVEFMFGRDNESDFRRCGNWTGDGYRLWAMFKEDGRIIRAVAFMADSTKEDRDQAGITYALKSGNCYRCGRKLTVPASITRGLGPDCAEWVG
jgi:hypothetical protein